MSHMRRLFRSQLYIAGSFSCIRNIRLMSRDRAIEERWVWRASSPSILNFPGFGPSVPCPLPYHRYLLEIKALWSVFRADHTSTSVDRLETTLTFRPSPCTLHRACHGRRSIAAPPCPFHRRSCPGMRWERRSEARTRGVASPQTCVPWSGSCMLFVRWMRGVVGGWIDGMQQPRAGCSVR